MNTMLNLEIQNVLGLVQLFLLSLSKSEKKYVTFESESLNKID